MSTDVSTSLEGEPRGGDRRPSSQDPPIPLRELLGDFRDGVVVLALAACVLSVLLFGLSGRALVTAFTASAVLVLAAIDFEHRILPNRIVLPAIAVVLVAQIAFYPDRALEWVLAGVAAALFLALPLLVSRGGMGGGDIKLAVLLGAALGWQVFSAIVIACLAIVPIALWMLRSRGSIRSATLPFGPFLAFGTLLILFTS